MFKANVEFERTIECSLLYTARKMVNKHLSLVRLVGALESRSGFANLIATA